MKAIARVICLTVVLCIGAMAPGAAGENWTLIHDIALLSKSPSGRGLKDETVTADLYRPNVEGRVPAAVIINSSGGVSAQTDHFYARLLAEHGVAALVVDSFRPRGVRETMSNQRLVNQSQSAADAVGGFRWLVGQPWADRDRIIVLGMSRGGSAALDTAVDAYRINFLQARDVKFAAHVAISPACMTQNENARTTGAPIFFQLSELDDLDPIQPCLEYMERMRAAGNRNLRLAVYSGVYHGKENVGGLAQEGGRHTPECRFFFTSERHLIDRKNKKQVPPGTEWDYIYRACATTGPFTLGGDPRVKAQAAADLLQFLRDIDITADMEARTAVPDCTTIPEGIYLRNCVRARAGWTGDMVALGRAYRYPDRVRRDDAVAAALFKLAAQRDHPQAMWELAVMHREGAGLARDLDAGLSLLRSAAAAGYPPAINSMGVWARDGVGQPRSDTEAVKWFREAADLLNDYAMYNLGRMYWLGRGGLAVDRVEAVKLYRAAVYYENPWGRLYLAEALEKGEGTERDTAQALELYRAVAGQDREPGAQRLAREALTRLGSVAPDSAAPSVPR
jgi:TPR repeat protein/dienelactone hydrolase